MLKIACNDMRTVSNKVISKMFNYGRVKKRAGKGQWAPPQQPNAPVASVVGSTQTPRSLFDPLAGKSTILSVLTDP